MHSRHVPLRDPTLAAYGGRRPLIGCQPPHTLPHVIASRQYIPACVRSCRYTGGHRHSIDRQDIPCVRLARWWYTEEVADRVREQCRLFNEGVRTGDWSGYLATFVDDGILRVEGDPSSPYVGRAAIARAY